MGGVVALWWLVGVWTALHLRWDGVKALTWGDVLTSMLLGFVAPFYWAWVGLMALLDSDFWYRPILRK